MVLKGNRNNKKYHTDVTLRIASLTYKFNWRKVHFIYNHKQFNHATNLCSNCTESYQVATVEEMADGTQFDIFKQFLNKPQIAAMTVI